MHPHPTPRRTWLTGTLAAATTLALSGCATPRQNAPLAPARPWAMPGTLYLDLPTAPMPGSTAARHHRIMVYLPAGDAPAGGFPVIYVLDGNLMFPLVAQLLHNRGARGPALRGDSAIVIGLGHALPPGSQEVHDRAARAYDYTPPYPGIGPTSQGQAQGGADRFLDFIATQVQPLVARQWPVDMERQTLVGHSFGGLCVLHTLLTRPGMFQRHVAGSPSLWWEGGRILDACTAYFARHAPSGQRLPQPLPLHLSQGSEERRRATIPANPEREVRQNSSAADLPALLAPVPNLACDHTVWPGADHGGAIPFVCMQAVRVALVGAGTAP